MMLRSSGLLLLLALRSTPPDIIIDDFETTDGWKATPSDGVSLELKEDAGLHGKSMRLDFDFHGIKDKLKQLNALMKELKLDYSQVAYVGDDINDIEVLKKVAFAFCPSSAQPEVLELANVRRLMARGGGGVIRELHNLIK